MSSSCHCYPVAAVGALLFTAALSLAQLAAAEPAPDDNRWAPDQGKLPLTAGFNDIDGAGGGGLVPWALITGYGTSDSWGANAHYTVIPVRDFRLQSYGAAVGALDRAELSMAIDRFNATGTPLDGAIVEQHVFAAKVRLSGDAVYDQDTWAPQTAVGVEYKRNGGIGGVAGVTSPRQLGAASVSGIDYYVNATKVFLAESLLVDVTVRSTDANQFGLLGFGGDLKRGRSVEPETSIAYLLSRTLAVGAEYRASPHDLRTDDEQGAWDAFIAWTANRHVSVVAAYVRLGSILAPITGDSHNQDGGYVSIQAGF